MNTQLDPPRPARVRAPGRRPVGRFAPVAPSGSKVPEVTAYFWIAKGLTTGMGETTSDYLVHTLVPEIAVLLGGAGLLIALVVQFTTASQ